MNIQTKYHGNVSIEEKDIWYFEKGIPGFDNEKKFILLPFPDNDVYQIIQSIQTPEIGFVAANPFAFFQDYDFVLEEAVKEELSIETEQDIVVFAILTVKHNLKNSTANLQAPVILNRKNNKGKQVILNNTAYKTRHTIFSAAKEKKG